MRIGKNEPITNANEEGKFKFVVYSPSNHINKYVLFMLVLNSILMCIVFIDYGGKRCKNRRLKI